ncbi:MAG: hypothetical protein AB8I08_18215, partial [Sandaracinaceae bacterium]
SWSATLSSLPSDTWRTSESWWMDCMWSLTIDLWMEEGGRSDLTLSIQVYPDDSGYRLRVIGAYVL